LIARVTAEGFHNKHDRSNTTPEFIDQEVSPDSLASQSTLSVSGVTTFAKWSITPEARSSCRHSTTARNCAGAPVSHPAVSSARIAGGTLNDKERPEEGAARGLEEELGVVAGKLELSEPLST
jgi:hypothetical protein